MALPWQVSDRQAGVAQERVGQVWGLAGPLDAAMRLVDHLGRGRPSEVGQLDGVAAGPQALDRVQLRGGAGSRSTTSQDRWVASQARMARLRWARSPSHSSVAFSPPRNRRSPSRTWIGLSVS
jgi:hypothetical protein